MTESCNRALTFPVACMLAAALAAATVLVAAGPASANGGRPFTARYSVDAKGGMTMASNTLMTCDAAGPAPGGTDCPTAQSDRSLGEGLNLINNHFQMIDVDVDSDPSTANSSSAKLMIPAGGHVLFAGLYWLGSMPDGGTEERARQIKLKAPGDSAYRGITAHVYDAPPSAGWAYDCFENVTKLVRAKGSGTWTVADALTRPDPAGDVGAGWSLVVVYSRSSDPLRRISVHDGQMVISPGNDLSIGINGFRAASSGSTGTQAGFIAFDGDRGESVPGDDYAKVNGSALSDPIHAADDFFNSSIGLLGAIPPGMDPNYGNQLGYDASIAAAPDGALANGATSATLEAGTTSENFETTLAAFSAKLDPGSNVKVSLRIPRYVVRGRTVNASVTVTAPKYATANLVKACGHLPPTLGHVTMDGRVEPGAWGCWRIPSLPPRTSKTFHVKIRGLHTGWGATRVNATSAWTGSASTSQRTAVITGAGFTG